MYALLPLFFNLNFLTVKYIIDMLNEYARKVAEMRDAQRNFFATRQRHFLIRSKELEKEVDRLTEQILHQKPGDVT